MQIFHFLVGNADAHGKNYALLHPLKPAAPSLAPLYDVVCTAAYPALTKHIAMSVGGRNLPDTTGLNHWLTLVPTAKASQQLLTRELALLAKTTMMEAVALHKESAQLEFNHPILRTVLKVIKTRATKILDELGTDY